MIQYENGCVGCPPEKGCLHDACPYRYEEVYTCDECGSECDEDELYEVDGKMICKDCIIDYLLENNYIETFNPDHFR